MLMKIQRSNIMIGVILCLSLFFLAITPAFASSSSIKHSKVAESQNIQSSFMKASTNAPAPLREKLIKAIPLGNCAYSLVTIWYNNGANAFCVTRYGYNGLDFNLQNVTFIGFPGGVCVNSGSWFLAYYGNTSRFMYFNGTVGIYDGFQPPYKTITQISVVRGC